MSEGIKESIPTSAFRKPAKRVKTGETKQAASVDALFANPNKALEVAVGPEEKSLGPPPELVNNVQGSSAGAGSGEFHVYKASRRREYERLRLMDEETEKEEADRKWQDSRDEVKRKEEAKLSKNRARREKLKARQSKAKEQTPEVESEATGMSGVIKKKLGPANTTTISSQTYEVKPVTSSDAAAVVEDGITFLEDG